MDRWEEIDSLFHSALEREPSERDAWLRRACGGDPDLLREVGELVANHRETPQEDWAAAAAARLVATEGAMSAGSHIGPYEIVALIGAGGMGEVYRARDRKLNRDVALKVLPPEFANVPDRLARFTREARLLAALNHPNIAAIYGVEEQALVMEMVEGQTVADRISHGRLSLPELLSTARQIAEALEYAHEKGIVHRDLKPANIKLTPDGRVKLLDFGLAKALGTEGNSTAPASSPTLTLGATRVGAIMGTAAYMSPEQVRGAAVDQRSDIWAFGVVLYEMLAGKRLFTGESVSDIVAGVLRAEPDWSILPADTPPRIRKLLHRCLERDRKQRLRDIGEARIAIDAREEEPSPAAYRRPLVWIVATAVLAIVGAIGWLRPTSSGVHPLVRISAALTPEPGPGSAFRLDSETVLEHRGPGSQLALSPDGTRLAITMRDMGGQVRLGTRRLDQSRFTPLLGTENASSPFFSPDSQWIAFFADGKLKKSSVQGGAPQTLCDAGNFPSGSWGDDVGIIAALDYAGGLSRIPSGGGQPVRVTDLQKDEFAHRWPQVLPGGQAVLFTAYTTEGTDIEVYSFKTRERKTVVHGSSFARYLPGGYLVYLHRNTLVTTRFNLANLAVTGAARLMLDDVTSLSPTNPADLDFSQNGTFVYVSGKEEPARSVFWMDRTGHVQPLLAAPAFYSTPSFSPDGKRLVYTLSTVAGRQDIWVRDLDRDGTVRLTSLPALNTSPIWTPNGKSIVFRSNSQPTSRIYGVQVDGSGEVQLLGDDPGSEALPTSISPDGQWLVMETGNPFAVVDVKIAPIGGAPDHPRLGKAETLFRASGFPVPTFSPDGHWLAYSSRETGTSEVYVRPFPAPGGKWPVSTGGGQFPVWSRRGHELFFLGPDRRIRVADYTAVGDTFVPGKPRVWSQQQIVLNHGGGPFPTYAFDPDGKRAAVILYPDGTAEDHRDVHLTFLLNFLDELRQRVPAEGR